MKAKPRWMKIVIATAKQPLPPLPFARTVNADAKAETAPKVAQA